MEIYRSEGGLRPVADQDISPCSTLDEIINRVQSATSHALTIFERLSDVGDRAFGAEPGCKENNVSEVSESAVGRVHVALSQLENILVRLEFAENRIHRIA